VLFDGNEDVSLILPAGRHYRIDAPLLSIYREFAKKWGAEFRTIHYSSFDGSDRSEPPALHAIAAMCASVGISGRVSIRPYLNLSEDEKARARWATDCVIIQSSGMGALSPMANKQWFPERFQAIVDELKGQFKFVQLGSAEDPPLKHAKDLRNITTMREAAAIMHHARLYVGTVGFLMHLARAVECPSVIVFGGREAPWQSGYICNLNLYTPLPCAPCWRWNTCEFDRQCMRDIRVGDVISAIQQMMERPRGPLDVGIVDVPLEEPSISSPLSGLPSS
jgi:ADP-heptose:LPS heptosyltransferase